MDKLADPDTSFLVPCAHCDALFQEGERFCPACGEDQLFSTATTASKALSPDAARPATAAQGVGWLRPRTEAAPDDGDLDHVATQPLPGERRRSGRRSPALAWLGGVAALALLALAATWGWDRGGAVPDADGRQRMHEVAVAQVRAALERGDIAGAERAFATLDAKETATPDVLALKQDLDQRVLEQAQRRDQLSDAALRASRSLGFGEAATVTPPPPSPPPARPAAASPKDCNEALAALSLC
jgi:hypothetical protein